MPESFVGGLFVVLALTGTGSAANSRKNTSPPVAPFSYAGLSDEARHLAARPYRAPPPLPDALARLSDDQYREIHFRRDRALWRDTPFTAQFFTTGASYKWPVAIHLLAKGRVSNLQYAPNMFDFASVAGAAPLADFAGVRIHATEQRVRDFDELVAFQGASFFRALGKGQSYGLAARGLAVDTAAAEGEEFPWFRELWLEPPAANATSVTLYALLDSPSVTGAYAFTITPGETVRMEVQVTLFARRLLARFGVAPLSSMYLFGENDRVGVDDYRPEVHDSDGLLIAMPNGERVWRPLRDPETLTVNAFAASSVRGFGLMQRDRDFSHYQDLDAHFERMPSAWVEPVGDWGSGQVMLIQIPAHEESNANVVAFWQPAVPLQPGASLSLRYRLLWGHAPAAHAAAETIATSVGAAPHAGSEQRFSAAPKARMRRFVVDFAPGGGSATTAASEPATLEPVLGVSTGQVLNPVAIFNHETAGYRLSFDFLPDGDKPSELRCFLRSGDAALTETWSYLWTP